MNTSSTSKLTTSVKQYSYCPFDKNHLIESCKLLKHINKCKSPTRRDYVQCSFNPYHWINFQQQHEHEMDCPDRDSYRPFNSFPPPTIPFSELPANTPNLNSSFMSDISRIQSEQDLSQINRIAMDFDRLKTGTSHQAKGSSFKRKINHFEMKELNQRNKLWEEPNFSEWYDKKFLHNNFAQEDFDSSNKHRNFQYLLMEGDYY